MVQKIVLSICLVVSLNAGDGVFVDKNIYKTYTDKQGKHTIYAENYMFTYKYEDEDKKTIKKIKGYLNNTLEWTVESDWYLTKTISDYSVIDDLDKDGIKDVILVYGFNTLFSKSNKLYTETYISFKLAIIYKNQVAKITHHSDADDCFRYTEVDDLFYTFPQPIIDKTIKMLEKVESEHYIPIPNDFQKQMKEKQKYLWDTSCGKLYYPWNHGGYTYVDIDGKRKIELYKDFSSLSNYCKKSGFKESEIRALNPWLNKKATNIPPDAEIIIPMLDRRGNYVVK